MTITTLYFRGLGSVHAGSAAVILLLEPLTGTVLAVLLLRDRLGLAAVAGALLLAAAVVCAGLTESSARSAST